MLKAKKILTLGSVPSPDGITLLQLHVSHGNTLNSNIHISTYHQEMVLVMGNSWIIHQSFVYK